MRNPNENLLVLNEVDLIFKNFSGRETKYNADGKRTFCVEIPNDLVPQLMVDGWNIKTLPAREEGEEHRYYLQVKMAFDSRPPVMWMVTSGGKTRIPEEMCELFDQVDIGFADVSIRPYEYSVGGRTGISAYLKTLYINAVEDPLDEKYRDIPEN